ncbi:uncharacterized protein LOC126661260 [Mercurialis annua]|uniref:uncharacterized protein LOC126661260 n=1 Tax=Mercurialis annua TaxID=3986 RepID=UPI00215F58B7|nr:uncharacterized protein LOC126661260 [Mercurialis annua]XP_055960003.1 uncharacterized protein LOC126661260 [Mercurialis annua]
MAVKMTEQSHLSDDKDSLELLKTLDADDILEILSSIVFCGQCHDLLCSQIQDVVNRKVSKKSSSIDAVLIEKEFQPADATNISLIKENEESVSTEQESHLATSNQSVSTKQESHLSTSSQSVSTEQESHQSTSNQSMSTEQESHMPESVYSRQNVQTKDSSPASLNLSPQNSANRPGGSEILLNDGLSHVTATERNGLSEDQKEQIRLSNVVRKKNFVYIEKIDGKRTNILEGLQLHNKVFNPEEQKEIVEFVYDLQRMGQKGQLKERTYTEPQKWMRGKGRVTMQFGCCYNYTLDKVGNPPGIIRDEEVDPLPSVFKQMIKRMVRWQVLPSTCIPNSCIVNIYDEGDCIPPHIDHHDFLRPFCTVSFLSECNILFGSKLKIISPGEFSGPVSIPLPVGSVLILNGNGADVAKHCIPGVPAKRISITFRKMDDSKLPYDFLPEPELVGIKPFIYSRWTKTSNQQSQPQEHLSYHSAAVSLMQQNNHQKNEPIVKKSEEVAASKPSFSIIDSEDFPALGSSSYSSRRRANRT